MKPNPSWGGIGRSNGVTGWLVGSVFFLAGYLGW